MTTTAHPPSYSDPAPLGRAPTYTEQPNHHEQRIALASQNRALPSGSYIKESKGGGVILRLSAQEDNAELPIYGVNGRVDGSVELPKTEIVESVEVKIEGRLLVKELGEGGESAACLCLDSRKLWEKDHADPHCPSSLPFTLSLPNTFSWETKVYPLPPSFNVKLSGLPGFIATVEYTVSAIVSKPHTAPVAHVKVKANLNTVGINLGTTIVSTPFIFYPRTRPAVPLPLPLEYVQSGFKADSDWKVVENVLQSRSTSRPDILTKLYIPSSRTYCISQTIPFHLTVHSQSSVSLAAFLPFSPTGNRNSKKITQIQVIRQTTVDVKNEFGDHSKSARTDMWRRDCIGEGTFRHEGDGQTWISFSGEIQIDSSIRVTGFKAAALSVKDYILFTITPHDLTKSPFWELREVIPVRLTTDPWTSDPPGPSSRRESILDSGTPPDDS